MKITQMLYENNMFSTIGKDNVGDLQKIGLVLVLGKKELIGENILADEVLRKFPFSEVVFCSTAGEIIGGTVKDDSIVVTAIEFENTIISTSLRNAFDFPNSFELGKSIVQTFPKVNLAYILVLSDGLLVNGTQLVTGMEEGNDAEVLITGGLAGDGIKFEHTLVGLNDKPAKGNVVAVGFYGSNLEIRSSSVSGWDVFGPERIVTRSNGTEVFEIDNSSAIDLYKIYLGPYVDDKTNSTLLFPLAVKLPGKTNYFARSILSIDYNRNCMIFAGDIPEGSFVRFMKASFEKLIDASDQAAKAVLGNHTDPSPDFALLVSCVGRKVILDKQTEEEVAVVADSFDSKTAIAGFYSYGEISPQNMKGPCELHNQTMTITTFREL